MRGLIFLAAAAALAACQPLTQEQARAMQDIAAFRMQQQAIQPPVSYQTPVYQPAYRAPTSTNCQVMGNNVWCNSW